MKPHQEPYARHVFFCSGKFCDAQRRGINLYNKFPHLLGDLASYYNSERVKRGIAPCLGVCQGGPLMVVSPDGTWYHDVDEEKLEQIIEEHLREGRPVETLIFHQLKSAETTF